MSNEGIHFNKGIDLYIKRMCQREYEKTHTRAQFMGLIGRNYILEEVEDETENQNFKDWCRRIKTVYCDTTL